MSGRARPAYDPWRDVDGTPIPVGARVEQVAVAKEHGALSARLHQRGEVIRRGSAVAATSDCMCASRATPSR